MTVKEIVKKYLIENGYDGLCNKGCGCEIDDLVPCDGVYIDDCIAGHKEKPSKDNFEDYDFGCDLEWVIVPGKANQEEKQIKG